MAIDIANAEDASAAEEKRYERAYRETRRTLDEAIETLAILEELETDRTRRDDLARQRLQLDTERVDLVRANIAFHAGKAVMVPPSPELVSQIVALSKEAVELTVERATASAVLTLARSALSKFSEIQELG